MKVNALSVIIKTGDFVEVLLETQLTEPESQTYSLPINPLLNLIYNSKGECFAVGFLDDEELVEVKFTDNEVNQINTFLRDNRIYDEVLEMLGLTERVV